MLIANRTFVALHTSHSFCYPSSDCRSHTSFS